MGPKELLVEALAPGSLDRALGEAMGMLTVLLVHALDLPDIHSTLDDIVVEFIEESSGGELGSGESGQRMSVQTIDDYTQAEEREEC